jgi:hypothetical protein
VIHFKTGNYSRSPAGRTLNQRLPFFDCGTIKSPPSPPYQYSEFDACAPLRCGYAWNVLHKRRSAASSLRSVILLLLPPRSPIHVQGVEFRLLRGPQRENRSAIDLDTVFRHRLQPTSSGAQAQFVAYSNDVISVSKIALVGKNGLVVALAFDRNALIHGWPCSTDGTRQWSQRLSELSELSDQRERVVAAGEGQSFFSDVAHTLGRVVGLRFLGAGLEQPTGRLIHRSATLATT